MSELNDPRVLLAAERTLLAWNRTSLAWIRFGFVVDRFGLFLHMAIGLETSGIQRSFSFWQAQWRTASTPQYIKVLMILSPRQIPSDYHLHVVI